MKDDCPLTPALRELLQTALDAGTLRSKDLAIIMIKAEETIHTEFSRILRGLRVKSRYEARRLAEESDWIRRNRAA